MNTLSIENLPRWSWSLIAPGIFNAFPEDHAVLRLYRGDERLQNIAKAEFVFDAFLIQNVDGVPIVTDRRKAVTRLGGIRTFKGNEGRFDDSLKEVGAVIATNEELARIARRVNPMVFLIPNALDTEKFKPSGKFRTTMKRVGFAGNISFRGAADYKGLDIIRAACDMNKLELVQALYGEKKIPHDDMPTKFYSEVDCLVSASVNEGCSNVVMEALACGVPVLLTEVGYHGEALEDGKNCLFIERDIRDIAAKLRLLQDHPELRKRLRSNGRAFATRKHDLSVVAKQYDEILRMVADRAAIKEHRKTLRAQEVWEVRITRRFFLDREYSPGTTTQMDADQMSRMRKYVEPIRRVR